jgi:hypothetical protein
MVIRVFQLKAEIKKLKEHLYTKLEIDAEANEDRKDRLEQLQRENENLRITVQTLSNKPGRMEIRQFYIYQKALDIMNQIAPGFGPAWQNALRDGEAEIARAEKGVIPFIKRITGGGSVELPKPAEPV